ncbi:MAG: U32 family peptidase [Methanofollis sp.]|uniref:U32 family peptidase n=1 Tax=Methanofollis sp. TaxID=2052835 RepID=UPI00262B8023|nr:U32 family peptidase [Methanofollis sp.]MDD4254750.1 U32 family peptidase [Methanofollis sp.]
MHTKPVKIPELLAPAGSMEALEAAVAAGADAVYLGGTRFSARRFAANFDDDALQEAVDYAHIRGVAVHVTVNTLVHDAELPALADYLLFLYEIGVDAVLVQDVGLLRLARALVPGLVIHASTQMTVTTAEGVRWAAEAGCSRVVLAREVNLAEIEAMRPVLEETGCELEVFLHGALCYAYSGQCLLSSVIGGRSGNRGACAQPCRKPYALMQGEYDRYGRPVRMKPVRLPHRYLLSTKDICLYPVLDRVVAAPVSSLKIEGRMKAPAYVAVVTAVYRRALDAIAEGCWTPSPRDEEALAFAFTRGFTTGYLCGERNRGVIGPERPDNRGVAIGRVVAFSNIRMEATVALSGSLAPENGDGIAVSSPEGEFGCLVRGTPKSGRDGVWVRLPQPAPIGAVVSITRRASFESWAEEILRQERQAVRIDASVSWEEDGTPVVEAVCTPSRRRGAVRVTVRGDEPMGKARTRPLTADQIAEQLCRTGGTPYVVGDLDLAYPGGLFAPPSYLNALRRSLLEAAGEALCEAARPPAAEIAAARVRLSTLLAAPKAGGKTAEQKKPVLSVYTDTAAGVEAASAAGAGRIYFEPAECTADALASAVRAAAGVPLVWKWPKIVRRTFLNAALSLLGQAAEAGVAGVMVEGHGCAGAIRAAIPGMPIYGASGLNIWNADAVAAHGDFALLTLSPELSGDDIRALVARLPDTAPAVEVVVQGVAEAMVTEDCPPATALGCPAGCGGAAFGIRDEKGMTFPLWPAGECRTSIGNAVETCLIDRLPALVAAGVGGIAIDARRRGPVYAREMAGIYREALEGRVFADLKARAKALSLGGITAGAFVHGTE